MGDITAREIFLLRTTWNLIKKDIFGNGIELFIRFFRENPTYQSHFSAFKEVPLSQLKNSKKFQAHTNKAMYAITMLVDFIDDKELLVHMLNNMAENHSHHRINIDQFKKLQIVLMDLLLDKCGPELLNDEAMSAWDKIYAVILSVVKPILEEIIEEE